MNQHGTALAWQSVGFLLIGPPGCGKSTLALQLIDQDAVLIADDQVLLTDKIAICPPAIRGKLHMRDRGILEVPYQDSGEIAVIFQSTQHGGPLSTPPAIGVPVIIADFKAENIITLIKNTLSSGAMGLTPYPLPPKPEGIGELS